MVLGTRNMGALLPCALPFSSCCCRHWSGLV